MADQYKPGDLVPNDGRVQCTQYQGTQKNVKRASISRLATTGSRAIPRDALGST
jgi:hypothetical protein